MCHVTAKQIYFCLILFKFFPEFIFERGTSFSRILGCVFHPQLLHIYIVYSDTFVFFNLVGAFGNIYLAITLPSISSIYVFSLEMLKLKIKESLFILQYFSRSSI